MFKSILSRRRSVLARAVTPARAVASARRVRTGIERLEARSLLAASVSPVGSGAASALTGAFVSPGSGITVTGSTYVGGSNQGGTYNNFNYTSGSTNLAIGNGIVLTSQSALAAVGGFGTATPTPGGDADLTKLINTPTTTIPTFNANSLTLTFTAPSTTKSISFDFIFGSDEFPEFVGSYNDAFGVFLDGKQISFDAANKPITVNNNFFTLNNSGNTTDPDTVGKTVVTFTGLQDGLTPKITTTAPLDQSLTTHTIKFAIADAGDSALDSAVFLSMLRGTGSSTGGPTTGQPPTADAKGPYTVAVGGTVALSGAGTDPNQSAGSLIYSWDLDGDGVFGETGAAAANGAETTATPTFSAGSLTAGTVKTVTLRVTDATGLSTTDTATVTVTGGTAATSVSAGGPYTINEGSSLSLTAALNGGGTGSYSWDVNGDGTFGDATGATPTLSWSQLQALGINDGNATSSYQAKVRFTPTGGAVLTSAATTLKVNNVAPTANSGGVYPAVKLGDTVTLNGTATDPAGAADPLSYSWIIELAGKTVASGNGASFNFTPSAAGIYLASLTVTDGDGGTGIDSAQINVGNVVTPPPAGNGPGITTFTLVDGDTEKDVLTMTEGMTLDLAQLPKKLNIRAGTTLAKAGKVTFGYDAVSGNFVPNFSLELGAPFAVFGDFPSGNYNGKVLGLGSHTLTATASTYGGLVGASKTIKFNVVNNTPSTVGSITKFTIVNATTGKDLLTLTDGMTVSLGSLGTTKLNVRADVLGLAGSVRFLFDGKQSIEQAAPYAVFGDFPVGTYNSGNLGIGSHTLSGQAFSGASASGLGGSTKTITFNVVA